MFTKNILLKIYTIAITICLPLIFLRQLYKSIKAPDYRKRLKERLGLFPAPNFNTNSIWLHAASYGESVAALPIIKELSLKYPNTPIVVTTITPTGSKQVKTSLKDSVFHVYIPYDVPFAIHNFLKRTKPKKVIIMEVEMWPNLLDICNKLKIPTYLVNARLADKSMEKYALIPALSKYMLNCFTHIIAQYELDANNFLKLGFDQKKLLIAGNIKFDIKVDKNKINKGHELKAQLKNRLVICAASTHKGEEETILEIFKKLASKNSKLFLILVPRHPERFPSVEQLIASKQLSYVKRSNNEQIKDNTNVLLGDTMGELISFYSASDIAFVGGSLIPNIGGHNFLEAAQVNIPIITGHYLHNFQTISLEMQKANALIIVNNEDELTSELLSLIKNAPKRKILATNGYNFLQKNVGCLEKTMEVLCST